MTRCVVQQLFQMNTCAIEEEMPSKIKLAVLFQMDSCGVEAARSSCSCRGLAPPRPFQTDPCGVEARVSQRSTPGVVWFQTDPCGVEASLTGRTSSGARVSDGPLWG